jgi:hypothetical protein
MKVVTPNAMYQQHFLHPASFIEVGAIFGSLPKFGSKKRSYVDISTLGYIQKGASYNTTIPM